MKIEDITKLCESRIPYNDDFFGIEIYRKALEIAIRRLETISGYNEYYSGDVADFAIKDIEKLFS